MFSHHDNTSRMIPLVTLLPSAVSTDQDHNCWDTANTRPEGIVPVPFQYKHALSIAISTLFVDQTRVLRCLGRTVNPSTGLIVEMFWILFLNKLSQSLFISSDRPLKMIPIADQFHLIAHCSYSPSIQLSAAFNGQEQNVLSQAFQTKSSSSYQSKSSEAKAISRTALIITVRHEQHNGGAVTFAYGDWRCCHCHTVSNNLTYYCPGCGHFVCPCCKEAGWAGGVRGGGCEEVMN